MIVVMQLAKQRKWDIRALTAVTIAQRIAIQVKRYLGILEMVFWKIEKQLEKIINNNLIESFIDSEKFKNSSENGRCVMKSILRDYQKHPIIIGLAGKADSLCCRVLNTNKNKPNKTVEDLAKSISETLQEYIEGLGI